MIRQIAFNKPQQASHPSAFRGPSERNHSQNVRRRRVNNIYGDPARVKGTPVPGILTPVEIAHRSRRHARRITRLKIAAMTAAAENRPVEATTFNNRLNLLRGITSHE